MIIELYPPNTLEGLIAREWVSLIHECSDDFQIDLTSLRGPLHEVISKHFALMTEANWPPLYQHKFLIQLRNDLTSLTHGHPVTRQVIEILNSELETN